MASPVSWQTNADDLTIAASHVVASPTDVLAILGAAILMHNPLVADAGPAQLLDMVAGNTLSGRVQSHGAMVNHQVLDCRQFTLRVVVCLGWVGSEVNNFVPVTHI